MKYGNEEKILPKNTLLKNRYKILRYTGESTICNLYICEDQKKNQFWVVKELKWAYSSQTDRNKAFQQFDFEAQLLSNLSHPQLPVIEEYFESNGGNYIIMEYLEGDDLETIIEDSPEQLDELQVIEWGKKLCQVLYYLHNQEPQPIIFRDLKPSNVMITDDKNVKLIEFDISKIFDPTTKTISIAKCVSPHFSPFEQYSTTQTDVRSDIYSLGATLYYAATRTLPADAVDRSIHNVELAPPKEFNTSMSDEFNDIIVKSMALMKTDRFQSAKEMFIALETIYTKLTAQETPTRFTGLLKTEDIKDAVAKVKRKEELREMQELIEKEEIREKRQLRGMGEIKKKKEIIEEEEPLADVVIEVELPDTYMEAEAENIYKENDFIEDAIPKVKKKIIKKKRTLNLLPVIGFLLIISIAAVGYFGYKKLFSPAKPPFKAQITCKIDNRDKANELFSSITSKECTVSLWSSKEETVIEKGFFITGRFSKENNKQLKQLESLMKKMNIPYKINETKEKVYSFTITDKFNSKEEAQDLIEKINKKDNYPITINPYKSVTDEKELFNISVVAKSEDEKKSIEALFVSSGYKPEIVSEDSH